MIKKRPNEAFFYGKMNSMLSYAKALLAVNEASNEELMYDKITYYDI